MDNLINYIKLLDKKYCKTYKEIQIIGDDCFINVSSKTSRFYKDLISELEHYNIKYHLHTHQKGDYTIHFYINVF
jgi:hypothetical protein